MVQIWQERGQGRHQLPSQQPQASQQEAGRTDSYTAQLQTSPSCKTEHQYKKNLMPKKADSRIMKTKMN
jgi:hypothetical protein